MKYVIPAPEEYFVATTLIGGDRNKKCESLYKLSKDYYGLLAHPLSHILTSYEVDTSIFPFEVNLDWFKARELKVFTKEEANQIIWREQFFSNFIKENIQHFKHCNMYRFDWQIEAHPVIPVHHGNSVLCLARLQEPVFLRLGPRSYTHVTHISNMGELVTNLKDGFKHIKYKNLSQDQLEKFTLSALKIGFAENLESHLTNPNRQALKRHSKCEQDLRPQ